MTVIDAFGSGPTGSIYMVGLAAFLSLMSYAAISDVARFQIPNWISLAIVADFILVAAIGAHDPLVIAGHLAIGMAMLLAGFALFAAGLFGGGDAKLLAAAAVWFGWPALYRYVVLVALLGGVLALLFLVMKRFAPQRARQGRTWLGNLLSGEHGIPYGVAIAAAAWLMFCPLVARAAS